MYWGDNISVHYYQNHFFFCLRKVNCYGHVFVSLYGNCGICHLMWYSWTCPVDLHHHVWHPFDWFIQRKIAYYLHDISSFIFIFCIPDCFGNGKKCLLFHKNVTCWLFCIDYRDREWVSRFGEWEQMDMRDCFVMIRVLWNWIVVMLAQVIKKSWVSSLRVSKIHNMKINLSKTVFKKLCLRHFENCRHGWMLLESKARL